VARGPEPTADAVPTSPPRGVDRVGTGWTETYMGGSVGAERALFARIVPQVRRIQEIVARKQGADPRRAFHNKGVAVAVRLDMGAVPPDGPATDFLRPGATYEGFGRFSRSQSFRRPDDERDQRGFALRIQTDVGPQDFLFSNTPASFARDPVQFLKVATIFAESARPVAAVRVVLAHGPREGIRVLLSLLRAPDRRLTFTSQPYWTRGAFQFGDVAARLLVRPTTAPRQVDANDDPDALTSDLRVELRQRPMSFELCAQLFVDERSTPIEDSSRVWPESVAVPVVLGTVVVVQQDLDSVEARDLAGRVEASEAFSPSITPGLRPLGRLNRIRDDAYRASAVRRGATTGPSRVPDIGHIL